MECNNVRPLILIANESTIRNVLASPLAEESYRVHMVPVDVEALDYLELHHPDVIVSDIKMPLIHGLTLLERIRAERHETPVIPIRAWTPPLGLPGVEFIRKPFDLDHIMDAEGHSPGGLTLRLERQTGDVRGRAVLGRHAAGYGGAATVRGAGVAGGAGCRFGMAWRLATRPATSPDDARLEASGATPSLAAR